MLKTKLTMVKMKLATKNVEHLHLFWQVGEQ
jgi:hypothetical protein